MAKNFPIYDVIFDEEDIGMTAVSFVSDPAICQNFVYYSDQKKNEIPLSVFYANHEKREVVSPILIPNQLIRRYDKQNNVYYMRWSAETIQKIMVNYLIAMRNNNITIQHPMMYDNTLSYDDVLEKDVYMLDMWITQTKDDVINSRYGFSVPVGTLCVKYKVHNRALWNRIKSGELKGLSIEAFCSMVRSANLTLNKQDKQDSEMAKNEKDLWTKLVMFANNVKNAADELAKLASTDETESGTPELKYETKDNDVIVVKADGSAFGGDGNPLVAGEYALVDGSVLVVDAEGKFAGTKAAGEAVEEDPEVAPIAEEKTEEKPEDEETKPEEEVKQEENEEEKPVEETPKEDEEVKQEEEVVEDAPATLVEITIGEGKYMVPQEVADYIASLEGEKETATKEIAQMKSKMASASPAIAQVEDKKDTKPTYLNFNLFK